ncbi:MAG: DUF1810 domain-containing protein [Oscillospiraceae bacterium]|nr:DUF1810 domain-containing protein [Oscillospiraceae bacterium]
MIERFYAPHAQDFDRALSEIRAGRKDCHWMWYIFPQLRGLGRSPVAQHYGLAGLEEAKRFAADPKLGGNLRTITQALLDQPKRNANAIFGSIDAMKLCSSMTLFELADPACPLYSQVLEEFFGGRRDQKTMDLL